MADALGSVQLGPRTQAWQQRPAYAGIGSRQTPAAVLAAIEVAAARFAGQGWVLRTGMSPGADQAFYRGARAARGLVELYLPWPDFEAEARLEGEDGRVRVLGRASEQAHELAARHHPGWDALRAPARALLARDAHQLLGADLHAPVRLVVCWTADGSLDGAALWSDGTGQSLRIAARRGIAVLNLARPRPRPAPGRLAG